MIGNMEKTLNFVVLGTDHRFQEHSSELEAILESLAGSNFILPLGAIAEEYSERIGAESVAKRLANLLKIPWFNVDMTIQERLDAGSLRRKTIVPESSKRTSRTGFPQMIFEKKPG